MCIAIIVSDMSKYVNLINNYIQNLMDMRRAVDRKRPEKPVAAGNAFFGGTLGQTHF